MKMTITHGVPTDEELAALVLALNNATAEPRIRKDEPRVGPWRTSHAKGPQRGPRSWNRISAGTHEAG